MQAYDKTKYRFAHAIIEVMKHEPLEKITVKDIVKKAGLTRQTFYRYFKDKYDLVNWYFDVLAQKSFKQMGVQCTLQEDWKNSLLLSRKKNCFLPKLSSMVNKTLCLIMPMTVFCIFMKESSLKKAGSHWTVIYDFYFVCTVMPASI